MFDPADFVPSLREAIERQPLDLTRMIMVGLAAGDPDRGSSRMPTGLDRHHLMLSTGTRVCAWDIESLSGLFRGDSLPPVLGDYPEEYETTFYILELHVLHLSEVFGDRRDEEMREVYSALRRRPDGRSLGFVHDYLWQAAALVLGTRPLSRAEFEAILARLEKSCRTFAEGPTSRNYVATLRATLRA